jgi:uncharacterized membrane protein HdeD (DUF308 family)
MATSLSARVHTAAAWWAVVSVLMIVAGALAIAAPLVAGVAVAALVGWLLVFSGLMHLVFAFRSQTARAALWEVLVAIAYGVIGAYVLSRPLVGLASLTLAIAAYLFVEAVLEFVLSFELRPAAGSGWLLVDGVFTLIVALMIGLTWPVSSAWAVGTLVGISMLFSGISRLMLAFAVRRLPVVEAVLP